MCIPSEGYHRKLHTLEEITVHPVEAGVGEGPAFPESALRVGTSRTVRLTDGSLPPPPPVPPPLVADPAQPVRFDDAQGGLVLGAGIDSRTANDGHAGGGLPGRPDRAMSAMNHRPRRLGAPIAAVAAVAVLIVVLLLAGIHQTPVKGKGRHHVTSATHHAGTSHGEGEDEDEGQRHHDNLHDYGRRPGVTAVDVNRPIRPPTWSVRRRTQWSFRPAAACWLYATNATTGAVLYTGELAAGQSETVPAPGPITVEVGAPQVFSATLNGQAVTLPFGFQAPFTMHFVQSS